MTSFRWNYMNDSLRSDVFVRYHPESIACACIYLSARLLQIPLPSKPAWYLIFGVIEKDIKDICLTILALYTRRKSDPDRLEKIVDELKKAQLEAKLQAKGISGNTTPILNNASFSPGSKNNSPGHGQSPVVNTKENSNGNEVLLKFKKENNHVNSRKRSPCSPPKSYPKKGKGSSSGSQSGSPSPKLRGKTPPRSYKNPDRPHSRSRSKHRPSHKPKRSRSSSRTPRKHLKKSYKRSLDRNHHHSTSSHKSRKEKSKEVKLRRSRSRERTRR